MKEFTPLNWEQWWFIIFFTIRYLRLIVHSIAHWRYKSIPIPNSPTYSNKDVTIILPTISTDVKELQQTIESMLACNPSQVLLVTTKRQYDIIQNLCKSINVRNLRVFQSPVASKRLQVCKAIPFVETSITVMVDDDVTWPSTILPWLLAPFEDGKIGGVGTCQRVRRLKTGTLMERCYNWLGAAYIERRNFEILATHYIDGGTSCMSGRTCALRTEILQDPAFKKGFENEKWGKRRLNADDDNFVTRWLVSHQWKTWVQSNRKCEIETTLENSSKFLLQCLRWARSNWRSNYISLFVERYIWRQQPWCTYALHLTMFINFAMVDFLLFWLCYRSTSSCEQRVKISLRVAYGIWWLTTKNIKLIGLYKRNLGDIWFLPVSILYGYFHSFIKLYAALTLHETGWGSRMVLES
ncbi:nucleotide-diphospho-sugar transferase [Leptodontidium sp. 2 PMI_412]|nr:nucleotide-diphospho-sugar transferase [Leptodontidium sp. 2 PMI_412]